MRQGDVLRGATLSSDGLYRYHLWRKWGRGETMVWIMLNPSTADGDVDDQTVTKCMGFARRWGYVGIEVLNLYSLRTPDPMVLRDVEDPEGPLNAGTWSYVLKAYRSSLKVAAWGGSFPRALPASLALAGVDTRHWRCLGHTTEGHPRHPARIAYATTLQPLNRERNQ